MLVPQTVCSAFVCQDDSALESFLLDWFLIHIHSVFRLQFKYGPLFFRILLILVTKGSASVSTICFKCSVSYVLCLYDLKRYRCNIMLVNYIINWIRCHMYSTLNIVLPGVQRYQAKIEAIDRRWATIIWWRVGEHECLWRLTGAYLSIEGVNLKQKQCFGATIGKIGDLYG